MTSQGHYVMGLISLLVVQSLIIKSGLKQYKEGKFAWEAVLLIPVFIFIANTI